MDDGAEKAGKPIVARCGCGALSARLPGYTDVVVACHCRDCQLRTGAPVGVGAYYPLAETEISGTYREFARSAESGGTVTSCFCPACGTSLFWRSAKHPGKIGVAVGCIDDPDFPGPVRSVWEQSKRGWITIEGVSQRYPKGRT